MPKTSPPPLPPFGTVRLLPVLGGSTCAASSRVVVDQMKYSGSDPQDSWTISARLIKNTRKSGNNSVLRRLADAFQGLTGSGRFLRRRFTPASYLTSQSIPLFSRYLSRMKKGQIQKPLSLQSRASRLSKQVD